MLHNLHIKRLKNFLNRLKLLTTTIADLKDLAFSLVKQNWNRQKRLLKTFEQNEKNSNRKKQEERVKMMMFAQVRDHLKIQSLKV